ncbi:MAG: conjugal transfer protein TraN [Mariprofundales bacterium]
MYAIILVLISILIPANVLADARTNPNCVLTSHVCTDTADKWLGNQWVSRACWNWRDSYNCADGPAVNDCQPLINQGCTQLGSKCISTIADGSCGTFEQTYQCLNTPASTTTEQVCGVTTMCADGTCFDTATTPNGDFGSVAAQFAAAIAAGASAGTATSITNISIFEGTVKSCNKTIGGAKNCCSGGGGSGWGSSVIKGCPTDAQILHDARDAKQAHYVGTWCPAKFLGVCLRHQEVWCTFPSKLARIVIEQGRIQLGIGWGSAQAPQCRGFTPTELQSLDFAAMDLREFYNDITAKMTMPDPAATMNNVKSRITNYYSGGATNGGNLK